MIDTHCHIYLDQFNDDLPLVLDRAFEAGVREIMMPAINLDSLPAMDRLQHPTIRFYKMAGVHPCEIKEHRPDLEKLLTEIAGSTDIIAVGETGLDYYWSREYKEVQQESFRQHCRVAKKIGKPVVMHNRDSTEDLLKLFAEEQDGLLRGVWHCFSGTAEEGLRAVELGMYLGIGGVVTFKNSGVDRSVSELPVDRLILETDAPYLAPVPHRGKRNEPAYLRLVAEKLAQATGMDLDQVVRVTTDNARRLFGV
jgi:TatD DNase family protein